MQPNKRPIGVDLFAGAGGMSFGFEQAGFDILASIEIDPVHCATHEFNFPESAILCRDITNVTAKDIRSSSAIGSSKISVVFGGLPCQGFSIIGKRDVDDPRNKLADHFIRLVVDLDADFFVIENVRGLTFGKHRHILDKIVSTFEANKYQVAVPSVLNAARYGVPQNRERLFVLGCKEGLRLPKYPSAITTALKCSDKLPLLSQTEMVIEPFCPSVWDAIGDLPNIENYPELLERDWIEAEFNKPSEYSSLLRGLTTADDDYSYPREYNPRILTSSLRPNHKSDSVDRFKMTEQGKRETKSHFHKLHPEGVSPTLRAGTPRNYGSYTAARPIHPYQPRCITVREAARLHSYPDWFRFHVTNWHGLRQVGNSVPPLLAKAVAAEVMRALGEHPLKPSMSHKPTKEQLLKLNVDQAAKLYGVDPEVIKPRIRKPSEKKSEVVN
ncbi:MAG: DNA cytosine methyltransferase [Nodosilinea sp. WJT8-NPBG4]|jgi:DNA (cytosine-5)-methyltransferase 1|nr:DNA cytosine methyltransferase [Nodosilinea sp. WJT8-NPBG4]